jgi:hypothetical protein
MTSYLCKLIRNTIQFQQQKQLFFNVTGDTKQRNMYIFKPKFNTAFTESLETFRKLSTLGKVEWKMTSIRINYSEIGCALCHCR